MHTAIHNARVRVCARVLPHSFACTLSRIYLLFSIFFFITAVHMRGTRQPHRGILASCASCDLATVIAYISVSIDSSAATHIVPFNFRCSNGASRCIPSSSPTQHTAYDSCHERPCGVTSLCSIDIIANILILTQRFSLCAVVPSLFCDY